MCAEERALPVSSLRQLAKSAPYIRYLCLRFTYEKAEKVAPAFERIIRALAPLPLAYLLVDVDPIDGRPTNLWIARILSLARRELPTLRVLRLQCGVQVMGWKVVVDELGEASWVHMTNEENSELKHIYEWEWRNIQIDETLLSQFD
ncbi:hypothetical protein BOTBODRAFT_27898 [Botryobasidium botryosum FD-172 SS1]|uniref:Uncharacterized protein n=1 Tax=Botryobasidium botryosum (strain FD-172 SS1) TaxID=930990 RepID=A0A067MXC7_BOTB1|nr:hypothetical protein BOTBODRAFT_27898 [Botryobasidium botryosum FD-172 SS1]